MATQTDKIPGSKWWKVDFHIHTPASSCYKKEDVSEVDLLKAAMSARIDCIVITDHNAGTWIDKLKTKNGEIQTQTPRPDWYRELAIFPGVEITVADSANRVHLLAIFDTSSGSEKITSVLGACGITDGFGDSQNTATTKSFVETVVEIEKSGGIALPAHIDGEKGLLHNATSLSHELKTSLQKIYVAEFCDLHKFDGADSKLKNAIEKIAKVGGSDAHTPEKIGEHYSWIKMGIPSFAGLRLALMDYEYCVKNQAEDPNHTPDVWFNNLEIKNMKYCGRIPSQPLTVSLNPGFNALIGGRGSGKSTLLESIRVATRRDQNLAVDAPKTKEKLDNFMSNKDGIILPDTEIVIEIWRNEKQFRLCWRDDQQGNVLEEKDTNGDWIPKEQGNLQERFPVSVFSQKQIEELASNPRGLLKLIDQSFAVNRNEWNSKWENTKSSFLQLREKQRDLSRRLSDESQIRVKLADIENDLKQYEEKGHGDILKNYQKRILQKNVLPTDDVFDTAFTNIRGLVSTIGLPDFPTHLFDEQDDAIVELKAIHERASIGFKEIAENLKESAQRIERIKTELNQSVASSKWNQSLQASIAAYTQLVEEYAQKGSHLNLSLYGEWTQQYQQLQQQLQSINFLRKELFDVEKQINEYYSIFSTLRAELHEKRCNFLNSVVGSNSYVRMELVKFGDANSLEAEYRRILNLDGETFSSSLLDAQNRQGILWELRTWQENNLPEEKLPDLIYTVKNNTINIVNGQEIHVGNIDNRLKARLKDLAEKQPVVFDQLMAWFPEDLLLVKYSKDPASGKFDNIGSGSAGQKAAAILAFLLSYGDQPLLIDQPEDDLDNALIYDLIVSQIHANKNHRQLIIATHNPNIVVNGDAELVLALKFIDGQVRIDTDGGLEEPEVRKSVCTIMEGGREAFEKRYKRITLEA
jgi:ABC-type lipoprotein export system ATPase subunit/histidinol phosphatase-like PHP family hydrolase